MKRFLKITIALILTFALCVPALAGPALPQEVLTRLQDNVLEYDEIPDLIGTYNPTVIANEIGRASQAENGRSAEATANRLESMAQTYEDMAYQAEATSATQAAAYLMQAETLRTQAADHVNDYRTMELSSEKVRKDIIAETKKLFLEYYRLGKQKVFGQQELDYLNRAYTSAVTRRRYGAGTEIEELTALEALQKAQAAAVSMDASISAGYKRLITMCGWQYDSPAEIGPEPVPELSALVPADKDGDMAKALEQSLTLRSDRVLYENAKRMGGTTEEKYRKQLENDTVTVRSAFVSAYDALILKKSTYEAKAALYAVKAQELSVSAKQLSLGLISRMEYAAREYEVNSARSASENAWYDLMEAKVDYDMALDGAL
ncbi:MAG: hypothetical protein MJ063_04220 [Lachnospiraceae bacterium]|nr:hypothetical protein [Lachnospiraceae bacterium]